MRTIERTGKFKDDYKRVLKGRHRTTMDDDLRAVLTLLVNDQPLPARYKDHPLSSNWKGHRDCHIHPDLVLIYRKPDTETLQLVRLGSHSELGF